LGFHAGLNLNEFWRLDKPEPGKTDFLYFADGTAHKNRMHSSRRWATSWSAATRSASSRRR
jgi:hypothetical protein